MAEKARWRWKCGRCGETFTAYATIERHVDQEHGAGRIECEVNEQHRGTDRDASSLTAGNVPETE